jgi:hypothetical protein
LWGYFARLLEEFASEKGRVKFCCEEVDSFLCKEYFMVGDSFD